MSHPHISWIPRKYLESMMILWTLDIDIERYEEPMVWIEHGIPDNHVIEKKQYFDYIYYFCSNEWTYRNLKEAGMKAWHVGSVYLDITRPSRRNPSLFVYCPQHAPMENHGFPSDWNHPPLTKNQILDYCKYYDCDGFVTSIVDDTQRDLYKDLNPLLSNRWLDKGRVHFQKCKHLYENAKVVYTDIMSTFDITAEAHGIKVIGREKQRKPRLYDHIDVLTDGMSCTRTLELLDEILRNHKS